MILALGAGGVLIAAGAVHLTAGAAPACEPVPEGTIVESDSFTPYENRMTQMFPIPFSALGYEVAVPSGAPIGLATLENLSVQLALGSPDGRTWGLYYLDRPISATMTPEDFIALGGIQLFQTPVATTPSYANALDLFPTRAVKVRVGPHDGALVWADPDRLGTRPHAVYWSDGTTDYSLEADRSAAVALTLAREVACH